MFLRILSFICGTIEIILAIPFIIFNSIFTDRIRIAIRLLIIGKRKRKGLLKIMKRVKALDKLEKKKKSAKDFHHNIMMDFVTNFTYMIKNKND